MSPRCDGMFCALWMIAVWLSVYLRPIIPRLPARGGRGIYSCLCKTYLGLVAAPRMAATVHYRTRQGCETWAG